MFSRCSLSPRGQGQPFPLLTLLLHVTTLQETSCLWDFSFGVKALKVHRRDGAWGGQVEKIGMSRKHLYNVSILMKIQYLACHMLRIMGSSLERQKQTNLCITYLPHSRILQGLSSFAFLQWNPPLKAVKEHFFPWMTWYSCHLVFSAGIQGGRKMQHMFCDSLTDRHQQHDPTCSGEWRAGFEPLT